MFPILLPGLPFNMPIQGTWVYGVEDPCSASTPRHVNKAKWTTSWVWQLPELDNFLRWTTTYPSLIHQLKPPQYHCEQLYRTSKLESPENFQVVPLGFDLGTFSMYTQTTKPSPPSGHCMLVHVAKPVHYWRTPQCAKLLWVPLVFTHIFGIIFYGIITFGPLSGFRIHALPLCAHYMFVIRRHKWNVCCISGIWCSFMFSTEVIYLAPFNVFYITECIQKTW